MKKYAIAIALLISAARLFAQDAVPTGTIRPVQLNHSVTTDNAKPGQEISARVMQDVPLPAGGKIRAGRRSSAKWSRSNRPPKETPRRFRYDSTP